MKRFLVILLFSLPAFAQDQAAAARMAAGCGPNEIQFDVKTDKHQHPAGTPEPGKTAVSLTTEAGKIYYLRTRTPEHPVQNETVELVPVDPAQAQLLIAASSFSTFHQKK